MSLAPFASLEARVNSAVQRHLANAVAIHEGGEAFGVIFDRAPAEPFGGAVEASACTCAFDLARAPGIAEGHIITINGVNYRVTGGVEPDETGWVQLQIYPEA